MNLEKKKIILIVVIVIIVVAGVILYIKFKGEKECVPLTPLALQRFEMAGGEKPVEGEKCEISQKSYIVKITYDSSDAADRAKMLLVAGTEGEKDEVKGYDWINDEENSSVFLKSSKIIGILVILDETTESKVEKSVKKAEKILK